MWGSSSSRACPGPAGKAGRSRRPRRIAPRRPFSRTGTRIICRSVFGLYPALFSRASPDWWYPWVIPLEPDVTGQPDENHDQSHETAPTPPGEPEPKPDTGQASPSREAAKYRRQLRETEVERDSLRAQLAVLRRAEVERVAADVLERPADAWLVWGDDPQRFLDDGGALDAEAVRQAAQELARERPSWRKGLSRRDPDQGKGHGGIAGSGGSWASLIRERRRGG